MTEQEFVRYRTLERAMQRHRSYNRVMKSRRSTKGRGKGVGSILRNSRVHAQVPLERTFNSAESFRKKRLELVR